MILGTLNRESITLRGLLMKFFNRHHLAIIPLLSILAMSPSVMETKFTGYRSIASIKEDVKSHPKYELVVSKVKPEDVKDIELSPDKYKEKLGELKLKLDKEREDFKKDQSDEQIVSDQRKNVEELVVELLLVEGSLKQLEEKQLLSEEDIKNGKELIIASKDIVESLLTDLESNEILVAQAKEPKVEEPKEDDKPVIADKDEPQKDEPKIEEPKKDVPVVAEKEEPKKEDSKKEEEPKKEVCEAEEQNKVLTAQVQELLKQQSQILQAMVGMTNMMVAMFQQQQQQNQFHSGPAWQTSPYQYHQPQTAGNWVYYPNGFQPGQTNIFAPQMPQQPMQQQFGIYPDQMHQGYGQQSNWMLQPSQQFFDPRYQPQSPQLSYGSFGMAPQTEPFAFNFGNQPFPTTALN